MQASPVNTRKWMIYGLVVGLALVLAALACAPTGGGSATSAPVATKPSGGSSTVTEASGGATQSGGGATEASGGSQTGSSGEINASNVAKIVELRSVTASTQAVPAGAVSGSDHTIATFSLDRTVRLWDGDTGKKLKELPKHADLGFGLAYSADGKLLASGAGFNVAIWDPATGKQLKSVTPNGFVYRMAFSPDGKTLVVAGDGRSKLDLVNVGNGQIDIVASPLGLRLFSGAYSADGKMLAAADIQGNLFVFDADSKSQLGTGKAKGAAWDVEFSPDSKFVTTCNSSDPGGITTWDTSSFTEVSNLTLPEIHKGGCADGVYSKNGDVFFSVGADGVLNAWETSSGKLLFSTTFGDFVWSVSISGDGKILAITLNDGTMHVLGLK